MQLPYNSIAFLQHKLRDWKEKEISLLITELMLPWKWLYLCEKAKTPCDTLSGSVDVHDMHCYAAILGVFWSCTCVHNWTFWQAIQAMHVTVWPVSSYESRMRVTFV